MAHFRPSRSCHTGCVGSRHGPSEDDLPLPASAAPQEPKWAGRCRLRGVGLPRGGAWSCPRRRGRRRSDPPARVPAADRRGRHRGVGARRPPTSASSTGCCRAGWCPGSVTVLGGEPGIGKSTLLLQALAGLAKAGQRCLYVTAEESAQQVRLRAERLGALPPHLWLVSDTALPHVLAHIDAVGARRRGRRLDPDRVRPRRCRSAPGSVAQVRECAHRLVRASKERGDGVGARRPRHQGRRAGRARGCSSTSSTRCCPSRASATTRCACCAR